VAYAVRGSQDVHKAVLGIIFVSLFPQAGDVPTRWERDRGEKTMEVRIRESRTSVDVEGERTAREGASSGVQKKSGRRGRRRARGGGRG
jgi:hypothetical protein